MKFQKSGRTPEIEIRRQRIACWLNEQRLNASTARTAGEFVVSGMPTSYDWLREQVKRLTKPGDRTIARNLLARWEADSIAEAEHRAQVAESQRLHREKLIAWLSSLPSGAQYTTARRGGYVAVINGNLFCTFKNGAVDFSVSGPYIESPDRPLASVADRLASEQ